MRHASRAVGAALLLLAVAGCTEMATGVGDMERTAPETTTPSAGLPADAETWRGLRVCSERPRDGYDRDDYGTGYRSLEDDIIAALPPTMKADGKVYTPYSCIAFDITPSGTGRDRHRAHRCAGGSARQRNRRRSAPGPSRATSTTSRSRIRP